MQVASPASQIHLIYKNFKMCLGCRSPLCFNPSPSPKHIKFIRDAGQPAPVLQPKRKTLQICDLPIQLNLQPRSVDVYFYIALIQRNQTVHISSRKSKYMECKQINLMLKWVRFREKWVPDSSDYCAVFITCQF